ncbi:MAG: SpoIIE family protein phosphatase [Lachnospiraceae bacterium]|nr:SpoIIE family protein phosphatase [Lachnospiraceae bacterium]
MKEKVVKPFFIQMMGLVISQCNIFGTNPLALGWFGAMTTMGSEKFPAVSLVIMTLGTYYAIGFMTSVRYALTMCLVWFVSNLYKKKNNKVSIEYAAVLTGSVTIIMELADWFMRLDVAQVLRSGMVLDNYYELFIKMMIALAAGSGASMFAMAVNSFVGSGSYIQSENSYLSRQIDQAIISNNQAILKVADGFKNLSYRIMELPHNSIEAKELETQNISEQIKGYVCNNCFNCSVCWGSKHKQSYDNILEFADCISKQSRVTREKIPEGLKSQCINQKELIMGTNHLMEKARINFLWKSRMVESRMAVAIQLGEMADMVESFVKTDYKPVRLTVDVENYLKEKLKDKKIVARRISIVEDNRDIVQIKLCARAKGKNPVPLQSAIEVLERYVEHKLVVKRKQNKLPFGRREYFDNDYQTVELIEEPNFMALYGVAGRKKNYEQVSGDNYTVMEIESGQMFVSVCDGMGSGITANKYSRIVVDLLEQFLKSGFGEDTSLRLINSLLMIENHWDSPIALDIGIVDLYSGNCNIAKMGAACTYIKRGNWVECIKSVSLPMGALQNVEPETVTKKLYDGDFIIMVSDGVIESVDDENREYEIGRIIMGIDTVNPKKMADMILSEITDKSSEISRDDMTVIVLGIWDKIS